VPDHLRITFAIEDPSGRVMAHGFDLDAVRHEAAPGVREAIAQVVAASARQPVPSAAAPPPVPPWSQERASVTDWDFGDLPTEVEATGPDGLTVRGYPALVPTAEGVALRLLADPAHAEATHPVGLRALLFGELALPTARLTSRLRTEVALPLATSRYPTTADLVNDAQAAVLDALVAEAGPVRSAGAFAGLRDQARDQLEDAVFEVLTTASGILAAARQVEAKVKEVTSLAVLGSVTDARDHLGRLLGAGFLTRAGLKRLPDLRRYLAAESYRLDRLGQNPAGEAKGLWSLEQVGQAYAGAVAALPPGAVEPPGLAAIPWMIEELRVSLFAQTLGTAYPVSEKRISKAIAAASP
jgi:ATP-dependent helicase HrpA